MNRRSILAAVVVGGILAVGLVVPLVVHMVEAFGVRTHQRSVTRSLAQWEAEYGRVRSWTEADRAIGMLEYVQWYYVPGPGYRSDPQTEAALEAQRARTVAAIVAALRDFTGEDFGTDAARWRQWGQQRAPQEAAR